MLRPHTQPSGIYHLAVGDVIVTAINDGLFDADFDLIAGIERSECERIESAAFRPIPPQMTMNAFLLQLDRRLVLIDTGCGVSMGPKLGMLLRNLDSVGVKPADIDTILITHLHPDHINGLIDGAGSAVFPRAELFINEVELQFFTDERSIARAPAEAKGFFAGARLATAAYLDRIRTFRAGPILPGVTAIATAGHTPGHTAYLIVSGGDSVLIWGDIVHMPILQFTAPQAGTVLDIDRELAVATRCRILDMAATDRLRVAGIHLDFPTFGRVIRSHGAYRFLPEVWRACV